MDPNELIARLLAWGSGGGTALPPAPEPGTVWYVKNSVLGISSQTTREHPCIVIAGPPEVQLIKGSHDQQAWGPDAVTMILNKPDMDSHVPGKGLDLRPTHFALSDVQTLILGPKDSPGRYIGKLRAEALRRVMMRLEDAGIGF